MSLDGSCYSSRVEMNGLPINYMNGQSVSHTTSLISEKSSVSHELPPMTTAQVENMTNSAIEHVTSVALEHGYDSMLHESMLPYDE